MGRVAVVTGAVPRARLALARRLAAPSHAVSLPGRQVGAAHRAAEDRSMATAAGLDT